MSLTVGHNRRPPLTPRRFGIVNWRGLYTLCLKEVLRFGSMYLQTILAPIITTLLFLAVFALAFGRLDQVVHGFPFLEFLAPGLIVMAMAQNAFANTSSSLMIAKVQGNIVDLLMPPLTAGEVTFAFVFGGVMRGLAVGLAVGLGVACFVPLRIVDAGAILFFAVAGSAMMGLMGVITAIWAEKFDHVAFVTNFVITPFAFLSGTFYTVDRLPETFQTFAHLNPFFYMIDGFRGGFLGTSDAAPWLGMAVLTGTVAVLTTICYWMLRSGYKLKT
jgi:ABC-2 type transport system permease protein